MALTLVLNDFSGPLDLLWHLIRTNEIDIYDIPIAEITSQYLNYLHQMQQLRLDVAGDYFVLAASLMALKSRMLLPQPEEVDQPAEEYDDPRADLVAQLLTYQVYQNAAKNLQERETQRSLSYAKPASLPTADVHVPMAPGAIKLRDLTTAMQRVVAQQVATATTIAHIEAEPLSVQNRIAEVLKQLHECGQCDFAKLVSQPTVDGVVTTFLAILELMKNDQIDCAQDAPFEPIIVTLKEAS
ncbi:segregation and condensation protein A [Lacticaseibacillus mingshuiensis]|uniref:Segregation and condensation protein A n=1 Tax=Lacticaseibacillus mingshuiensis TaxID=2799574 RepID=A0ABW4CFH2_9LACO|nr:segregation/condensation protein A [Lacticaseibacillus mingshuiensis]